MKFLTIKLSGALPTSFRLFQKGLNTTENGDFLFDEKAARSVMKAYAKAGVDVAIDLEHQMLAPDSADPTAKDARGWCKLELRADGSLWATEVRWTEDGAKRLAEKRQRYISPAFEVDDEGRPVKLFNIALTSTPATHNTPALVAAAKRPRGLSKRKVIEKVIYVVKNAHRPYGPREELRVLQEKVIRLSGMPADLVNRALDVIASGDEQAALDVLKDIVTAAASGDSAPPAPPSSAELVADPDGPEAREGDDSGSSGDGAEGVGPAQKAKLSEPGTEGGEHGDRNEGYPTPKRPAKRKEHPSQKSSIDRSALERALKSGMAWLPPKR